MIEYLSMYLTHVITFVAGFVLCAVMSINGEDQ